MKTKEQVEIELSLKNKLVEDLRLEMSTEVDSDKKDSIHDRIIRISIAQAWLRWFLGE